MYKIIESEHLGCKLKSHTNKIELMHDISSFQMLKENLEITGLQKSIVSTRQNEVRYAVARNMDVLDSFLTGSYARSTMIAPLSKADIDIFIVLDKKYNRLTPVKLLNEVKNALLKTYTNTSKISRNGQAVTITFNDFIVDVVPAFNRQVDGYYIPNSPQNTWIETNPKTHVDIMRNENSKHNGYLVPIVKMIKGWNRNIGSPLESFYLELLVMKVFGNKVITDFQEGVIFFFNKAPIAIRSQIYDPVPYGGKVKELRKFKNINEVASNFKKAYSQACKAKLYTRKRDFKKSADEWKNIFGGYFPTSG